MVWREIGISVARSTHPQMDGYEIWLAAEHASLGCAGRCWRQTRWAAMRWRCIASCAACRATAFDLRERDLAQETGQEHALSFIKGCYIGQEIVERVRARGNVHRMFHWF